MAGRLQNIVPSQLRADGAMRFADAAAEVARGMAAGAEPNPGSISMRARKLRRKSAEPTRRTSDTATCTNRYSTISTFAVTRTKKLWLYAALLVVLILLIEWATYHRRITV